MDNQKLPHMLPRRILRSNTVNNASAISNNDPVKVESKKLDFELLECNLKDMESNLCKLMDNTENREYPLVNDMFHYGMQARGQNPVTQGTFESLFALLLLFFRMTAINPIL
jgi:hypothetical protein